MDARVKNTPTALPGAVENRSFGRILQDLGKLQAADVERVLLIQSERGLRFGEAARQLGLISDSDIQQVMARQFDYRYLQPGQEKYSSDLVAAYQPFSAQAEMLRAIRGQLVSRWFSAGHRALTVVGSHPSDRASLLAANLAVVFAQLGKRTLLVDANLRTPSQHAIFHLGSRKGLSDLLVGRAGPEAIVNLPAFESLFVLPSGSLPPNPHELLNRERFAQVYEKLTTQFHVVLCDAPSFTLAPDSTAIAARTGGVMVVARNDHSRASDLLAMKEQFSICGAEIVGSVMVDF